jgi:hypothetical protein
MLTTLAPTFLIIGARDGRLSFKAAERTGAFENAVLACIAAVRLRTDTARMASARMRS